jgi:hypothetical protein
VSCAGAEHVGVEQRCGLGGRRFLHRADQVHSRFVDQHVDARGLGHDGLDRMTNGSFVADIHLDKLDVGDRRRFREAAYGAEDLATSFGELLRGDASDARRHAGNNDNGGIRHDTVPIGMVKGISPEFSRAAKRRRLE